MKRFLSLGVPFATHNSSDETPLFVDLARSIPHLKHPPLVTSVVANLFTINLKGQDLLHVIARKEVNRELFLTGQGLDPTCENDEQRIPLDLGVAAGNAKILRLWFEMRR